MKSKQDNFRHHKIIEHPELEQPHQDHQVQLLVLHDQESHHVPGNTVQILCELCQAQCCEHFTGEPVPVLNHPLGG